MVLLYVYKVSFFYKKEKIIYLLLIEKELGEVGWLDLVFFYFRNFGIGGVIVYRGIYLVMRIGF